MKYEMEAETCKINLSPVAFHRWAEQYHQCRLLFQHADFSPIPYFLLCRAIELQFKAVHLEDKRQQEVKKKYGHDLIKSYDDLPATRQTLSKEEVSLLEKASEIYNGNGFEYVNVDHAAHGFSNFPDLSALDAIAAKIIGW
ncbi:MAG: hypothetical protein WAN31_10105 [Methylovirgula sp.]